MSTEHLHAISEWLDDLAKLIAGSQPVPDLKEKLALYAVGLSDDFDPQVFTRKNAFAVAKECNFFPKYSELCTKLRACRVQPDYNYTALPGPGMHKCFKCEAKFSTLRAMGDHFRALHMGTAETDGAKWERRQAELRVEWDDPPGIRAKVHDLTADYPSVQAPRQLLAILVARWAPQHFHLIPPTWAPNVSAEMDRAAKAETAGT